MISAIIADLKRDLAQATLAGEPDNWNLSVSKADIREMIEALNGVQLLVPTMGDGVRAVSCLSPSISAYVAT